MKPSGSDRIPATSSDGAWTSRYGGAGGAFVCSTSTSSHGASPRTSRTPVTATAASSPGRSPPLEAWIDARWREGTPLVVLGDFNRAMDRHGPRDHLWRALDDGDPPGLKLYRLPNGRESACWRGTSRHHRHPIDFFVFGALRLETGRRIIPPPDDVGGRRCGRPPRAPVRSLPARGRCFLNRIESHRRNETGSERP